jgi:hypothetical protein
VTLTFWPQKAGIRYGIGIPTKILRVLVQVLVLIVMLFPTSHSIQVVALKSNKLNGFRQKSNICTD